MRISDWSSDVCSSDLASQPTHRRLDPGHRVRVDRGLAQLAEREVAVDLGAFWIRVAEQLLPRDDVDVGLCQFRPEQVTERVRVQQLGIDARSEEHTSELQSLMRISYAVFCLKKTKQKLNHYNTDIM